MLSQNDVSNPTPTRLKDQLGNHDANKSDAASEFLKVREIAATMRVSSSVVIRLVKQGRLPALNLSAGQRPTYRVSREAFEQFKRAAVLPAPKPVPAKPTTKLPPGVELFV
jgi:excisionase family DNA binding protein